MCLSLFQFRTLTSSGTLSYHCKISWSRRSISSWRSSRAKIGPKCVTCRHTLAQSLEYVIIATRKGESS